jgi:hypothetical protein
MGDSGAVRRRQDMVSMLERAKNEANEPKILTKNLRSQLRSSTLYWTLVCMPRPHATEKDTLIDNM